MRRHQFPDYFGTSRSIEPVHGNPQEHQRRRAVYGGYSTSAFDDADDDIQYDDPYSYAVQPVARPPAQQPALPLLTSAPRTSISSSGAFRPNQWAQSGAQYAPRRTPAPAPAPSTTRAQAPPRRSLLREFAYRELETHNTPAVPSVPRKRPPPLAAQTPRRQSIQHHNISEQTLPQTPWSNRPAAHTSWLRRPRTMTTEPEPYGENIYEDSEFGVSGAQEDEVSDIYGVSTHNSFNRGQRPSYAVQAQPTPVPQRPRPQQRQLMAPPTPRHSSPSPLATSRARIQPRPRPAPQVNGIQLVSPQSLDKKFQSIFPYQHFNAVQSSCFSCVYGSSYNVVVAAPTGSGKTAIFELAICKLLASREKKDFKIVYQAPTKALCSERTRDWQNKFKPLGLQVAEFTGDTSAAEVRRARTASVIITTPEKWDSITRKWSDHSALLKTIKLVLIDEVHILKDTRGATLETVVSRMKTLGSEVRFVALSATIPNSTDIAKWLGLTHTSSQVPAKTFVCGNEFRPVRLEKIVIGYNVGGGNEHSFDSMMDDQLPDLIVKHAQGKPVLIFCFTRKSTESAATVLSEYWNMCPNTQKPWPGPAVTIRSSTRLKNLVASGVAFHHGGLERQDRTSIEEAFLHGHLSIVYCTSTLAIGVNLPCHTVILKGTMGYQNGKFSEYDEFEVMQMIGRAGRPQFDTSATAIILTRTENRGKYLNIESGCQTVESTLHLNLIEHLNSEIVLGTVTSMAKAVQWLRGTFLAVRLRQNPDHYKLTDKITHARTTDEQLEEICKAGIARLIDVGLIQYLDGSDSEFKGTQYGSAMSTYMVRFETMVMMLGFPKSMKMEELVNSLCHASEFDELRIKSTERQALRDLNKTHDIPFKFKDNIMETWQKISVLIQVELSRGVLPYQQRMAIEAKQAIERMQRLLESYIVCMIADNNGHSTKVAFEFSRSLLARAWEGHVAQLCQIPDIGPANMKKLADKQVTSVLDLAGLSAVDIERFLSKNPPAAMKIADSLKSFPRLFLDGQVAKAPDEGSAKAVAKVTLGCLNEQGLPRWRNKIPSVTFMAMTKEGNLLHIWRGKLQGKEHQVSFPVPYSDADEILCDFTCDDIVGTIYSLQLQSVEVPPGEIIASWSAVAAPSTVNGLKTSVSALRDTGPIHTSKRQKLLKYSTHPITVGNSVVDCIDLSAVDEADENTSHIPQTKRKRPQYSNTTAASAGDPFDSYAFQSMSVKKPRNYSGGGTQQDPLTLDDDSGSDDFDSFDAGIFDEFMIPSIKESPRVPVLKLLSKDSTNMPPPAPVFKMCNISPSTDEETVLETRHTSPEPVDPPHPQLNLSGNTTPEENMPDSSASSGPQITVHEVDVSGERDEEQLQPANGTIEMNKEKMAQDEMNVVEDEAEAGAGSVPVDTVLKELSAVASKEPSEPSWVTASSSSIVDFLRGHVRFV